MAAIVRSLISIPGKKSLTRSLNTRNTIYDYLSPTPSHLLNVSLADYLPQACLPAGFVKNSSILPKAEEPKTLPQGHHLVYFPPPYYEGELLSDGTDAQHAPGTPYFRRMWAGGSITFKQQTILDAQTRMACTEEVAPYSAEDGNSSQHDANPVSYMDVTRSVAPVEDMENPHLVETRRYTFIQKPEGVKEISQRKRLPVSRKPDFSIELTPTPSLLFRFSALTFNAHRIHLDPHYCREVEGYKDLLVHGPLLLVLMLSVARSQLREGEMMARVDYRNIAPVYVSEKMQICVRRMADSKQLQVWVLDPEGCYAVRATAVIGRWGDQSVDG